MSLGIVVSIICVLLMQYMDIFAIMLMIVIVSYFFFAPVPSLSDSATMAMLGADKTMYGRVRTGGTIGWGLFALIAGTMISQYGLKLVFWGFSFFMLINLFIAQKLAYDESTGHESLNSGGIRYFLRSSKVADIFIFRSSGRPGGLLGCILSNPVYG